MAWGYTLAQWRAAVRILAEQNPPRDPDFYIHPHGCSWCHVIHGDLPCPVNPSKRKG